MGQVLHSCASAAEVVRRAIQLQQELKGPGLVLRHQPHHHPGVAQVLHHNGRLHGVEGGPLDHPGARGGGHHCCLPPARAATDK